MHGYIRTSFYVELDLVRDLVLVTCPWCEYSSCLAATLHKSMTLGDGDERSALVGLRAALDMVRNIAKRVLSHERVALHDACARYVSGSLSRHLAPLPPILLGPVRLENGTRQIVVLPHVRVPLRNGQPRRNAIGRRRMHGHFPRRQPCCRRGHRS